jgi:hypothetical protein
MKRPVNIYCPTFRRTVFAFHQWTQDEFESYMFKNYKIKFDHLSRLNGCMRVIENNNGTIIVVWTRKSNPIEAMSCLTHEAVHATSEILHGAGVLIDTKNDELQAYHISMIVRETLKGCKCSK